MKSPKKTEIPGAHFIANHGTQFNLWAPHARQVDLKLYGRSDLLKERVVPLTHEGRGRYFVEVKDVFPGERYKFVLNQTQELPDPCSRYQPEGVHGPSEVVSPEFNWQDSSWKGVVLSNLVFYELHLGTFTVEGTFDAAQKQIPHLKELGVTAIELMPVAQFAGTRNWGYDGVYPYAVQNSYGGPQAFKAFVNACHGAEIAVYLDVVYNHLGPEGNYLNLFGDYFLDRYKTPWGDALNFDGPGSDEVRRYFLCNAEQWLDEFHLDGLRLDAIHAICDRSALPFLEELASRKELLQKKLNRSLYLVAESDLNDSRLLRQQGIDAQWNDDFHHALHALLTNERQGYYKDFGSLKLLSKAYTKGVVYDGRWSDYRNYKHGRDYDGIERKRLVVYVQTHDQIGNRFKGDRLTEQLSFEQLKLAATCVFISPFTPLLFMGEEWGEKAPFCYFVSHSDPKLLEAVRQGRAREFCSFDWQGEMPNPGSLEVFKKSCVDSSGLNTLGSSARSYFEFYKHLIILSKWIRHEGLLEEGCVQAWIGKSGKTLELISSIKPTLLRCYFSFSDQEEKIILDKGEAEHPVIFSTSEYLLEPDTLLLKPWSAVLFAAEGPSREGQ
jgi:maltooligosyltrehalose trehalohydrolase